MPGTVILAFNITLISTDTNRTVIQNIGLAILKLIAVIMSGKAAKSAQIRFIKALTLTPTHVTLLGCELEHRMVQF